MKKPELTEYLPERQWMGIGIGLVAMPALLATSMASTVSRYEQAVQIGFWTFTAGVMGYMAFHGIQLVRYSIYRKRNPED